jgi:hypothetical protein
MAPRGILHLAHRSREAQFAINAHHRGRDRIRWQRAFRILGFLLPDWNAPEFLVKTHILPKTPAPYRIAALTGAKIALRAECSFAGSAAGEKPMSLGELGVPEGRTARQPPISRCLESERVPEA